MVRNRWMTTATRLKRFPVDADGVHDIHVNNLVQGLTTVTDVDNEAAKMAAVDAALRGLPNILRFIQTYEGVPETTPCCEGLE